MRNALSREPDRAYAPVMTRSCVFALSIVSASLVLANALAQPLPPPPPYGGRLNLQPLNFDLWCQETAKLPPERCDKRLPQDDAAFNEFVSKVYKYEVPYLKSKQDADIFNRAIMHAEPSQNPANNSQQPPSPNP